VLARTQGGCRAIELWDEDRELKGEKVYKVERAFKEILELLGRDDPFIRLTTSGKYIITLPHPSKDIEYILCTYERRTAAREFIDLGTCVQFALGMGAVSITFRLNETIAA
jgi:hypothetical protein